MVFQFVVRAAFARCSVTAAFQGKQTRAVNKCASQCHRNFTVACRSRCGLGKFKIRLKGGGDETDASTG